MDLYSLVILLWYRMLLYIFCLIIATVSCAPADFQWSRIETLFTFGDSYTTQNLDLATLKYPCAECTSAGGINWVEALVALQPSIKAYWDLAYNSAPIANRLVGQVTQPLMMIRQYAKILANSPPI